MRVYVSVDIEGVCGVVSGESTSPTGRDYDRARKQMTAEANAAILGALEAGATEIVINDSHGSMTNLIPAELNEAAEIIQGSPKPLSMMEGVQEGFDAVIFIGYHARMLTHGILSHTISGGTVSTVLLNGEPMGETSINAAIAGYYNVPVVLVAGDDCVAREAKEMLGNVETVTVKKAITRYSARSLHPAKACRLIQEGVRRALSDLEQFKPYKPQGPYTFALRFIQSGQADAASIMPGTMRVDGNTVSFTHDDYLEAFMGLRAMISLARP